MSIRFRATPERNPGYRGDVEPLGETVLTADISDLDDAVAAPEEPEWLLVEGPKYLSVAGDIPRPYNTLDLDRTEPFIVVCEGELDTITAHQDGLPAIGIAGVNGFIKEFRHFLAGYRHVYVLADNDDKGQGLGFAEKIAATVPNTRIIILPAGHDVNSWYVASGEGSIRNLLKDSKSKDVQEEN